MLIREFTKNDWKSVHTYASDPYVTKHMIWGPNTEEETRSYIEQQIAKQTEAGRTDYEWAVQLKESNALIGGCSLYIKDTNAEIGYCFHPRYWGKGYASEASGALLRLAFGELGIHRVYATCRPANTASSRVLQRIGMKLEGHLREHLRCKGSYHDSYLFSILASEYTV
ncbi:GNAT family N-acetyltransferase [Paenibacillus caseinilyticus]|uniref:GNAT family N-acetyltransferase n=1 Tax=Paenibacillus caseinilyticus TaxID=3098138 RepID=UPI0029E81E82|nr:GNAT family N-acetyltransferase [Paenibacillus caseinilyticus]